MWFADRPGSIAAIAVSLAVHAAALIWFANSPPMFRASRPPAPIEVALVEARPIAAPEPAGGAGAVATEPERAPPAPPARPPPRTTRLPRPAREPPPVASPETAVPAPALPRAAVVDSGPAPVPAPAEEIAPAGVAAADLGVGAAGPASASGEVGWGGGLGGGGRASGAGAGGGQGGVDEVKPRELRRPSYAEMRALYPELARREGLQAKVRLQLLVGVDGRVADVRVIRAAGHGFDEAAVALARRFLFEPGRRDGRPAPMWITLTYSFEIEG